MTAEHFERSDLYEGEKLIRRGRPRAAAPKHLVTLRMDSDTLAGLRASGRGWQTRVNAVLRSLVGGHGRHGTG